MINKEERTKLLWIESRLTEGDVNLAHKELRNLLVDIYGAVNENDLSHSVINCGNCGDGDGKMYCKKCYDNAWDSSID